MEYDGIIWKNKPSTDSPINAANLEVMDTGIVDSVKCINSGLSQQVFMPLPFDGYGGLFNGSSSLTWQNVNIGYRVDEFSQILSGSSNLYGIAKEIADTPLRFPLLVSGTKKKIAVYAELADGVEYVSTRRIHIGTSSGWGNNQAMIGAEYQNLFNGFNEITLTASSSGTPARNTYGFFSIAFTTLAEAQKVKYLYIFPNADILNAVWNNDTIVSSISAGWESSNAYSPIAYLSSAASGADLEWSRDSIDENTRILTIPAIQSYSGNVIGGFSINIKNLFGKGYRLLVEIENSKQSVTASDWRFNDVHITQSPNSWSGANNLKQITAFDTGGKNTATIVIDDLGISYRDYENIYFLIAAYKANPASLAASTLKVNIKIIPPNAYVIADVLKNFDKDDYYTKDEIEDIVEGLIPNYDADLLFWGDSLTAGSGGGGTNYPMVCANILNKTYKNCGVGGETANTISARQGGNSVIIPAGNINGQYTINQLADVFGYHINPLRQGGDGEAVGAKTLYINGEACTLTISQTSSISEDAVYTISGYTGGASIIPLFGRFKGSEFLGKVVVIFVGQNGSYIGDTSNVDARISIIKSMLAHIGHQKYVILGLSSGQDSNRNSDDAAMLAAFGNKFFPTRKNLVANGLAINSITPTAQDISDISIGKVPESLRAQNDNIHLNAYGYTALGTMLADKIKSLGYFS